MGAGGVGLPILSRADYDDEIAASLALRVLRLDAAAVAALEVWLDSRAANLADRYQGLAPADLGARVSMDVHFGAPEMHAEVARLLSGRAAAA